MWIFLCSHYKFALHSKINKNKNKKAFDDVLYFFCRLLIINIWLPKRENIAYMYYSLDSNTLVTKDECCLSSRNDSHAEKVEKSTQKCFYILCNDNDVSLSKCD